MTTEVINYKFHPVSQFGPEMTSERFAGLVDSIKNDGLSVPITLFEGQIADGRHRYRACRTAGVEPKFEEWTGTLDDLKKELIKRHVHTRDWTPEQKVAFLLDLDDFGRGGDRKSAEFKENIKVQNCTLTEIAEQSGKHVNTVKQIKKVRDHGVPELYEKVKSKEVPASTAAVIATEPEEVQHAALNDERGAKVGVREEAKRIKGGRPPKDEEQGAMIDSKVSPSRKWQGVRHDALTRAQVAMRELDMIHPEDPQRRKAIGIVKNYCNKRLKGEPNA